jgi:hypothetical protein
MYVTYMQSTRISDVRMGQRRAAAPSHGEPLGSFPLTAVFVSIGFSSVDQELAPFSVLPPLYRLAHTLCVPKQTEREACELGAGADDTRNALAKT